MYKEWAFDLYPGLAFEDFIDRVEVVSKTHAVSLDCFDDSPILY
jgi:hypothetical protein